MLVFLLSLVYQILTNVKEITPATPMLIAQIPLDHKHVHATLDILEMDIVVQVNLIDFL